MIKLVNIDLEGVFFKDPKDEYIKNLAKFYKRSEDFIEDLLFNRATAEGGYDDLRKGKISSQDYWNWFFKALGLGGTKEDFLSEAMGYYEINIEVVGLIKKLKNLGIEVGLCSNTYKDKIDYLKKVFEINKYFDVMVFSYEVGLLKPDERIFQELLNKAGVEGEEAVYSDNKEDMLEGARQLGFNTFVYKNFNKFIQQIKSLGVEL